jgi:hypothetical protein
MTKMLGTLTQALRGERRQATLMAFVEIRVNCRAPKNIALARIESISLDDEPVIKIVKNWSK